MIGAPVSQEELNKRSKEVCANAVANLQRLRTALETLAEQCRSVSAELPKIARLPSEEQERFRDYLSWLRVSGTAKMPQIDQSVRHQLHTVVTLLFELKAQQKPFEFVFPREGPLHAEP